MRSAPQSPVLPFGPPHLLIADDDDAFLSLLEDSLRGEGYRVTTARTGQQLHERVAESLSGEHSDRFDLILSDVNMPQGSGIKALSELQGARMPPVVVMTAFGTREVHDAAFRLGAVSVLDKPFKLDDLCAVVSCLVGEPFTVVC